MKLIPTTGADLEKLKSRAKQLKRNKHIKHSEALELAARQAGYQHWHHVTLSHRESVALAQTYSVKFLCESIVKDAILGETHYIGLDDPPLVLIADGKHNAFALSADSDHAIVLLLNGVPQNYVADETSITFTQTYQIAQDLLSIDSIPSMRFVLDMQQFSRALFEVKHSLAFDKEFSEVFLRDGSVDITDDVIPALKQMGLTESDIHGAIVSGAKYSPTRKGLLYPVMNDESE